jgi:hypothetical protein
MLINGRELVIVAGAHLRCADLSGADLSYADLRRADLSRVDLRYADLRSADLRSADLRYADLRYVNLRYVNLSGADLRRVDLRYASLYGASLRRADLSGTSLTEVDLTRADLRIADLRGAKGIVDMGSRSDGYRFVAWVKGGVLQIRAGCRDLSLDEARRHWAATRGGTPIGDETFAMLDYAERMATIRKLIHPKH